MDLTVARPKLALALAVLALVSAPARHARAASFDCAKANLAHEKIICADKELSKLDEDLARAYAQARAKLSAQGQLILRDSQRSWLAFVRTVCPLRQGRISKGLWIQANVCMRNAYSTRIRSLPELYRSLGPYTVVAVEEFSGHLDEARDESGEITRIHFATSHFAYPQIDGVNQAAHRAWNRRMEKFANEQRQDVAGAWEAYSLFKVHHATSHIIVVEFETGSYYPGAAHGMAGNKFSNFLIGPGRELVAADLFNDSQEWREFLVESCWTSLQDALLDKSDIHAVYIYDERYWQISNEGLRIHHGFIRGYASGFQSTLLSWSSLHPYLVQAPPFPIPP